jgi:hypothetical protein
MATVRRATWGFRVDEKLDLSQRLMDDIAEDECQRWSRTHGGAFVEITRNPQIYRTSLRERVMSWEVVFVDREDES